MPGAWLAEVSRGKTGPSVIRAAAPVGSATISGVRPATRPAALACAALTAVVAALASSAAARTRHVALPARCTAQAPRLKTLSDRDRRRVRLQPRTTTIAALARLPAPRPIPRRRRTPFQRQAWRVVAQIVDFRLLADGSIDLVLYDNGAYVRAGMPSPVCLTRASRARRAISATRGHFVSMCGHPRPDAQPLGAVGYVTGVGFWSRRRPEAQAALNGAELQPVTGLRLIVGCR